MLCLESILYVGIISGSWITTSLFYEDLTRNLKVADTFPANKYNNKISELHRNAINDKNIRKWKLSYMKTTRSRRHDSLIGEITGDTNINMKLRPLNDQGQQ